MKRLMAGMLVATALGSFAGAAGQTTAAGSDRSYDVAASFTTVYANTAPGQCGCFLMYGGSAQAVVNVAAPFSLIADVGYSQAKNVNGSGQNLMLMTYQGGLRYAELYRDKWKPYAQGLFGVGHLKSNFSYDASSTAFAYTAGIGVDYRLMRRFDVRIIQAEYLGTGFPNAAKNRQGQVRMTAGLVLHLARPHWRR